MSKEKYSEVDAKSMLESEAPLNFQTGLREVRPYYHGLKLWPDDVRQDTPEGVVFGNLNICFQNAKNVSEGLLSDFIGGFKIGGIPEQISLDGIKGLVTKGYLTIVDNQGTKYSGAILPSGPVKVGYTNKFLSLLLEASDEDKNRAENNKVEL